MSYEERLSNVAVLGAAGKMGSGILLLTAVEMADLKLSPENKNKLFIIHAIDVSQMALMGLKQYLRTQVRKIATNRWEIVSNQWIEYDDDNTTALRTYNLFDESGNPSKNSIFDRQPV